jgi:TolB protein
MTDSGLEKGRIAVSMDGSRIIFSEGKNKSGNTWYMDYTLMSIRTTGGGKQQLVTDPSWSPAFYEDGAKFLYASYEGNNMFIVRANINGGGKTFISRSTLGEWPLNPSVKDGIILFDTYLNGERYLASMRENGSDMTQLDRGMQPSWHPTQNKFVFVRNNSIYEMDHDTNQVTELLSAKKNAEGKYTEWCSLPSFSRDGKYILFSKGGTATFGSVTETTTTTTGGLLSTMSFGLLSTTSTSTSAARAQDRTHLFVINADGSNLRQLTSGSVDVRNPAWGDNYELFFVTDTTNGRTGDEVWRATFIAD